MKSELPEVATLVSLIYETVLSPRSWSGLGDQQMHDEGHVLQQPPPTRGDKSYLDKAYLNEILPHLNHALEVGTNRLTRSLPEATTLSHDFALPICIVTGQLDLLQATDQALSILQDSAVLNQQNGRLTIMDQAFGARLRRAVLSAINEGKSEALILRSDTDYIWSILVSQFPWGTADNKEPVAALFLNLESGSVEHLASILAPSYSLSQSEAEVTAWLALGLSPEQIAEKKSRSINTVRTQIKQVFNKTHTGRQSELVALVLNGPVLWARLLSHTAREADKSSHANLLTLSCGRTLSYGDYGPGEGVPVILLHHLLGSRNERPTDRRILSKLNIRLIVPERPGIGFSGPANNYNLVQSISDIVQLADHLKLDQFHLVGFSTGGPFAAACAASLGDRVVKLGMIAAHYPVDELPPGTHIGVTQRFLSSAARNWPSLAQRLLEIRYQKLLQAPKEATRDFRQKGNRADRLLMDQPELQNLRLANFVEAKKTPLDVFAKELITLSRPWGFSLAEIKVPVLIWHGEQDEYFSIEHARAIANTIQDCRFYSSADWGHFFLYAEWENILGTLTST